MLLPEIFFWNYIKSSESQGYHINMSETIVIYLKDNCNNCALPQHNYFTLYFIYFFWILFFIFLILQYCIGFAIHQHESATGIHVFPILNPPPTSLPIASLWVIPVHQHQASCILHRTWTGDSFLIWYYTCFNAILPNHPPPSSPTESKRLFYTSVSLLLRRPYK